MVQAGILYVFLSRLFAVAAGAGGDSVLGAFTSSHGWSVFIIIAVAVLVGVVILITGLVCLKWYVPNALGLYQARGL